MSQASVILPGSPLTGADAAADMNAAWAAMISKFSGGSAPTAGPGAAAAIVKGQWWLDTSITPHLLKMYDGTNWVPILTTFDPTTHSCSIWNNILGFAKTVDLNTVGDTHIFLSLPTTNWLFEGVWVVNKGTTASLTNAQFGLFSAAAGGGTALVAGGTALSSITSDTINTATNAFVSVSNTVAYNFTSVYFRVTTQQGAAATADVYITGHPLP